MKSFQEFLTEAPLAEYDPSDAGERKSKYISLSSSIMEAQKDFVGT